MTTLAPLRGRTRAYLEFIAAVIYYFLARALARRSAFDLANDAWMSLAEQVILLLLLLLGFAAFGRVFDRQRHPISEQGFPFRPGWPTEAGLGMAIGWGAAIACVLPLTLFGGIAIVLTTQRSAWGWFFADAVFFAIAAMVEEIAFRGYGFQRFAQVVGPVGATLGYAAFYAGLIALQPGSSKVSIAVSVVFSVLLSIAFLRTRALWLSWGLNFAWKASRALIFGLALGGVSSHSSVVEGDPMGPFWITGGGYGLDGSWVTLFILLAAFPVVYRVTRDLDFRYNAPVIVPGGVAVDLDAAARRQHEAAMGPPEPSAPSLVQILPVTTSPASSGMDKIPATEQDRPR
jgi:membrane protease YdiL (CAAX protease family)